MTDASYAFYVDALNYLLQRGQKTDAFSHLTKSSILSTLRWLCENKILSMAGPRPEIGATAAFGSISIMFPQVGVDIESNRNGDLTWGEHTVSSGSTWRPLDSDESRALLLKALKPLLA